MSATKENVGSNITKFTTQQGSEIKSHFGFIFSLKFKLKLLVLAINLWPFRVKISIGVSIYIYEWILNNKAKKFHTAFHFLQKNNFAIKYWKKWRFTGNNQKFIIMVLETIVLLQSLKNKNKPTTSSLLLIGYYNPLFSVTP